MSCQTWCRVSYLTGLVAILLALGVQPAAAQCSVATNTGEHLYVSDPITGCRVFTLSGGLPTSKPRIRRGVTTHFLLVRHSAEGYKNFIQQSQGSISNQVSGLDANELPPIGWLSWDLTLAETATLGNMTLAFGPVGLFLDPWTMTVAVDRRGEITAVTQAPSPGAWFNDVNVTVTGRDIGNAAVEIAGHTVSAVNSGNTSLTFTAKATSTSAKTTVDMAIWDKANSKTLGIYPFPGRAFSGSLAYLTQSATGTCTSVPGLAAPMLQAPATGAVIGFASPTDPVRADVSFSWQKVPDPKQSYTLRLETFTATSTITGPTGGRDAGTVTLSPLGATEQTVLMPTSQASAPTVTTVKSLTRNRTYKWKVRGTNCGQSANWSTLGSFTVK
jgi:hypothetical protein